MNYSDQSLAVQALSELLENYYFDPVLWNLYAVCRYLYFKKPADLGTREIRVRNYHRACVYESVRTNDGGIKVIVQKSLLWLKGDYGTGTRDIILHDPANPSYCLVGLYNRKDNEERMQEGKLNPKTFYIIPAEWVKYIYVRYEANRWYMYLGKEKFCCRQVLQRGTIEVVQREDMAINNEYLRIGEEYISFPNYFHVGVGPCGSKIHDVLSEVGIYVNSQQLYKRVCVLAEPYEKQREIIYALGTHLDFEINEKVFNGKYFKALMRHLLVCRCCNSYVDTFINILLDILVKTEPLKNIMNSIDSDSMLRGGVPASSYILDSDFVTARSDAFRAPLKYVDDKLANVCKDIIEPFFMKYDNIRFNCMRMHGYPYV
ncbi:Hypothetical predicted protein [Paramuricea clavata]|uniref:Uncharacterized protein n=1 Tax=Paramuricea clavata TaxID=317549 RepID=A0A6S7I5Q5_PARCT|nr:Hypothetical predicted protein [Paramuricea clavata]